MKYYTNFGLFRKMYREFFIQGFFQHVTEIGHKSTELTG